MARKITVDFIGNTRDLDSALDGTVRRSSRFGDAMRKAGKFAAIGLGVGVVIAGKALVDMTKNAIADEAAQRKLAVGLQNATGATKDQIAAVEDWISAQGVALGVTDDELRPAFQRLVQATGDISEAQKLAGIAMDASAGSGKDLKVVTEAIAKAQNGNLGSLSRLGVAIKDAEGNTLSFDEAMQGMADTFEGQAAAKANTLEGKMDRLKLVLDETKETIGSALIPVLTQMATWFLDKGLPAIQSFGGWIQTNLIPIFSRIGEVIRGVFGSESSGEVSANLMKIKQIVTDVVTIIKSLWATFGDTILTYTRSTFANLKQIIGGALDIIAGIFKVISSVLKGDWKGAWDGIKQIARGALNVILGVVKQVLNLVRAAFSVAFTAIRAVVGNAWDGIKDLMKRGANSIVEGIRAIPGRIRDLGGAFKEAGRAVIGAMIDGLKNASGVISGIAGNVWTAVKGLLNSAISKINAALSFTISLPGPDISVNPPDIPHLAKGGIVRKPTLALIGEDGPEAVVPLGRKNAPGGTMPGGDTYIFHIQTLDPAAAGKAVEEAMRKRERMTGRKLLFSPA